MALSWSLLGALFVSSSASAWSPVEEPEYTFDISAAFDSHVSGTYCENWRDKNYLVFEYYAGSPSGTVIIGCFDDQDVNLGNPSSGFIQDAGSAGTSVYLPYICRWSFDGTYLYGCQNGYSSTLPNLYNIKINQEWIENNASLVDPEDLPPEYTGENGSGEFPNDISPRCNPWDIGCWFSSIVGSVVDSFQSLADFFGNAIKALGEWIANLIMPTNEDGSFDNRFTDFFTEANDLLHERLGVLLFPFDFIASFFSEIFTYYNPSGYDDNSCHIPPITAPNLLGSQDVSLNICGIATEMPSLWSIIQGIANIVWIIGLIAFLHGKYFDIVKGGDNV